MGPPLELIRERTRGTSWEGRLWLVGGAVRDRLLGRPEPKDLDLVLEGSALVFAQWCRETGLSEIDPVTYPRFGTAMVRVAGSTVELVTARKESYRPDSRKPDVRPATLSDDALRRDFTVNALYENVHTGELRDPLERGWEDLRNLVLRTPLDPAETFREDPLRMLRAVRFRWQLGMNPAEGLYEAIRAARERLGIVSRERIRDELVRMLGLAEADRCLQDLLDLGLLGLFAPELAAMAGVAQGHQHHLDVWSHTLLALRSLGPGDPACSLAVLLHDVGKPATRTEEPDGRIRFLGHERVGAEIAERWLRDMRFPGALIAEVSALVRGHMRVLDPERLGDAALRRLLRDFGGSLDRLLRVAEADASAHRPGTPHPDFGALRRRLEELGRITPAQKLRSPLSGEQIMALTGWPEGPMVGRAKSWLLERVLEGALPPDDERLAREALLEALRRGDLP
ncbi:MAG: HD domain-containing protein [Fimbriimonadales bacterium]|nr:HD domain-containing protein [Fimbriimonadales bacterium]